MERKKSPSQVSAKARHDRNKRFRRDSISTMILDGLYKNPSNLNQVRNNNTSKIGKIIQTSLKKDFDKNIDPAIIREVSQEIYDYFNFEMEQQMVKAKTINSFIATQNVSMWKVNLQTQVIPLFDEAPADKIHQNADLEIQNFALFDIDSDIFRQACKRAHLGGNGAAKFSKHSGTQTQYFGDFIQNENQNFEIPLDLTDIMDDECSENKIFQTGRDSNRQGVGKLNSFDLTSRMAYHENIMNPISLSYINQFESMEKSDDQINLDTPKLNISHCISGFGEYQDRSQNYAGHKQMATPNDIDRYSDIMKSDSYGQQQNTPSFDMGRINHKLQQIIIDVQDAQYERVDEEELLRAINS